MAAKDTSKPGPAAYLVFAALWLALGIWTIASPNPSLNHWLQLAAHLALATAFVVLALRRRRTRRASDPSA
jgi:membrane protein DedA with SNARE-associated domain